MITIKAAKAMSIKKWTHMVKHPLDEMGELASNCGFCLYVEDRTPIGVIADCKKCVLQCDPEFTRWRLHFLNGDVHWARYWAKKLLDKIRRVKTE